MTDSTALATQAAAKTPAPPRPQITAGGALAALVPQTLDDAFRLAKALSSAGDMVPKAFQGKPEETMAAIIRGMEIGLAPMQALSSIAVINGRASLWGDAMPALMQRAGHHIDVEYEGAGDALVAVATLTRGDNGKQIVRRFGLADAKRANLLGKAGPWQQYPQRMISHRARAWAIRDGAADALMGLQVAEEVSDYGPDAARDVTPTAPKRGGVMYADPDPVVDEIIDSSGATNKVTADGEILDAETQDTAPAAITDEQIAEATERGKAAKAKGMSRRACPPEYLDQQQLFDAWGAGWEAGEAGDAA